MSICHTPITGQDLRSLAILGKEREVQTSQLYSVLGWASFWSSTDPSTLWFSKFLLGDELWTIVNVFSGKQLTNPTGHSKWVPSKLITLGCRKNRQSLLQPIKLNYGKITKQQNSYITTVQIRPWPHQNKRKPYQFKPSWLLANQGINTSRKQTAWQSGWWRCQNHHRCNVRSCPNKRKNFRWNRWQQRYHP